METHLRWESPHWGQVTHICISKLTIIGSDNGLSPGWRQAIISTIVGILLIGPWGTNFSEILIEILTFYIQENVVQSVVCEVAAILSQPQSIKGPLSIITLKDGKMRIELAIWIGFYYY